MVVDNRGKMRRTVGGTREFENNHEHRIELVSSRWWRGRRSEEQGATLARGSAG